MRRIFTFLFFIAFTPHLVFGNIALTQLQDQKAELLSINKTLKDKNKELITERDKFKKQKKIFGITTALGVGGTLGTSIFAIKNKGEKKTAINQAAASQKSLAESVQKAKEEAEKKKDTNQKEIVEKSIYQLEKMKEISHLFFIDEVGKKIDLIQGGDLVCGDQIIGDRSCQLCTTEKLNHLFCQTERWTPEKGVLKIEFFGGKGWAYKEGSYWKVFNMNQRKYFSDDICENEGNYITSLKKVKEDYGIKNNPVRFLINKDAGLIRTTVERGKFLVRYTDSKKTDILYNGKTVKKNISLEKKVVVSANARGKTYTACPVFISYSTASVFGLSFFDKNGPVFILNDRELTKGLSGYVDI
ncbi:MAG: hypothetical protein JW812_03475, partial [Alphaproteobacteria bacterium]|nr:hypothetical protein [Alphaproteobacteria bacterium]